GLIPPATGLCLIALPLPRSNQPQGKRALCAHHVYRRSRTHFANDSYAMKRAKKPSRPRSITAKRPTNAQRMATIKALQADFDRRREEYRAACQSWQHLTDPVQRAEHWLHYISNHMEYWCDLEAVVYALSRGKDCKARIAEVLLEW